MPDRGVRRVPVRRHFQRTGAAAPPRTRAPAAFTVSTILPRRAAYHLYLRDQLDRAWAQDEARQAAFAKVRTEADLLALRKEMRARVLEVIGGLPQTMTPLNARITGTIPMDGYRIEKVLFESLPGLHVTALVYVPDAPSGPKPAVLVPCGHSPDGKSFRNYQEISGQLARRGYVVISWDPVGQGERSQYWDAARGRSRYNLVCGEHAVLGNLACVAGTTLDRYMVWDGMRAPDYLLTRPDVDATRIAVTGTSGGGFQSLYLGALDERIKVVAPSCFVTSLPMRMANRIFEDPDSDPEQDPYRLVSAGIDHPGLMLLIYPRPVILLAAVKDFFPIEGTRKTFREVAALYRAFGHGHRIDMAVGVHGHMYSPENRRAAFPFIDRFSGIPVRTALDPIKVLDARPARDAHRPVRVDHRLPPPGSSARKFRARRNRGEANARGPTATAPPLRAFGKRGHRNGGDVRVDRYRLYGEHRSSLCTSMARCRARGRVVVLAWGRSGRRWPAVRRRLDAGEVLSFDLRGVYENRMRYQGPRATTPSRKTRRARFNPLRGAREPRPQRAPDRPSLPPGGDRRRRDRVAVRAGEARGRLRPGPVRLRARAGRCRRPGPARPRGRGAAGRPALPLGGGRGADARDLADPVPPARRGRARSLIRRQDDSAAAPIAPRSSAVRERADRIHCAAADASPPAAMARPAWPK